MILLPDGLDSEPALAWKIAVDVRGQTPNSIAASQAAETVRRSPLVTQLLAACDRTGHAYRKWIGAHWTLSLLADLGYPPGDESLRQLMENTYHAWLSPSHEKYVRLIAGRFRRCASQEGNAIWSSLRLGLADKRTDELVSRLLKWQWPDGGWNCDKRPEADSSSFMESLIPLRALALYAKRSGDVKVRQAADRAAEVFLTRRLFKRLLDGSVMDKHFVLLCYPPYWHYHILFGLKVMARGGIHFRSKMQGSPRFARIQTPAGRGLPRRGIVLPPDQPIAEWLHPGPLGREEHEKYEPLRDCRRIIRAAHGGQGLNVNPVIIYTTQRSSPDDRNKAPLLETRSRHWLQCRPSP